MAKTFTWERGPFEECFKCGKQTFGLLAAGGNTIQLRCTECRYSHGEPLPEVDKVVIYLDQFVFSSIFKIKAGGRSPLGQQAFYDELIVLLSRVVLLQQVILPHSDFHLNETIVFNDPRGLRDAFEDIGGDASLKDSHTIEMEQVFAFAQAFRDGTEPSLELTPDQVVNCNRNAWLQDMRISVNTDYSMFADGIRRERDKGFAALKQVVESWAADKPAFNVLLRRELEFGRHRRTALAHMLQRIAQASLNGDSTELMNASMEPVWHEYMLLKDIFQKNGSEEEAEKLIGAFWDWSKMKDMPHNRILGYLFAAFGRRVTMGQRKFTRGLMNDFRAIATYAPYVDAMFVDRECAVLLKEGALRKDLHYRAKIFSYANGDAFLDYLRALESRATYEVRHYARRIYGIE